MASAEQPPQKRVRTESPQPIERGSPWLDDGNIVIQAENTQFRVFMSLLTASSPVFKDLFSMPQPSAQEMVDGCPVVVVHDAAEDWSCLLEAVFLHRYATHLCPLYRNILSRWPNRSLRRSVLKDHNLQNELKVAISVAGLSRKYQLDAHLDEALKTLHKYYSTSFADLDSATPELDDAALQYSIEVAKFSYEHDIRGLLIMSCHIILSSHTPGQLAMLEIPRPLLALLLDGGPAILQILHTVTLKWLSEGTSIDWDCHTRRDCKAVMKRLRKEFIVFDKAEYCTNWIFGDFDFVLSALSGDQQARLCKECKQGLSIRHERCREKAWDRLPSAFGFDTW